VVLEDVADGAGLLVERAAILDADRFRHGDLHVIDVAPVPQRLEDPIPEPEDQQVPDGLLAEVVVDAVDLRLAEDLADLAVQSLRRIEVVPERLLDDDPPPAAVVALMIEADPTELADDLGELGGLGGEVVEPVAAGALGLIQLVEPLRERVEALRIVEIETLVPDPMTERAPCRLVEWQHSAVLLECLVDLCPKRLVVVRSPSQRQQHELVRQEVRPPQVVDRRDDLAMGEVAGRAEQGEDRGVRYPLETQSLAQDVVRRACLGGSLGRLALARFAQLAHRPRRLLGARRGSSGDGLVGRCLGRRLGRRGSGRRLGPRHDRYSVFTAWPPNSFRNAARTFAPYESAWRERKRVRSESVMTGAGTS